jgi:hypothetical protein
MPDRGIAILPNKGKVSFILLGVAEPTRPNQHDRGLCFADGLFQRVNPRQTGLQALLTQDRIDFRRLAPVRAGVADEHIVGIVRHVVLATSQSVKGNLLAEILISYSESLTAFIGRLFSKRLLALDLSQTRSDQTDRNTTNP